MICEQTLDTAAKERENDIQKQQEALMKQAEEFVGIVIELNDNSDGDIIMEELCSSENVEVTTQAKQSLIIPGTVRQTGIHLGR